MLAPRRVRLATARTWSSSGAFAPASLAKTLRGNVLRVKRSAVANEFMFTAPRTRTDLLADDGQFHAASEEVEMAAEAFFERLTDPPPETPFVYFTAPIATTPPLTEMVPSWRSLTATIARGGSEPWAQVWAASAGCVTQAHFDVADNVFVQLHGRKTFQIWPPSAHFQLHFCAEPGLDAPTPSGPLLAHSLPLWPAWHSGQPGTLAGLTLWPS